MSVVVRLLSRMLRYYSKIIPNSLHKIAECYFGFLLFPLNSQFLNISGGITVVKRLIKTRTAYVSCIIRF